MKVIVLTDFLAKGQMIRSVLVDVIKTCTTIHRQRNKQKHQLKFMLYFLHCVLMFDSIVCVLCVCVGENLTQTINFTVLLAHHSRCKPQSLPQKDAAHQTKAMIKD